MLKKGEAAGQALFEKEGQKRAQRLEGERKIPICMT